jgi:lysozyme
MIKKSTKIGFYVFAILLLALFAVDRFYWSGKPVLYPNFGIEIPSGYSTHGIDVSRYQKEIDWELVSNMRDRGHRISFAITKATEGVNLTDGYFKQNWKGIKEQKMLRGAYLYFHPNKNGKAQATYFMSKVKLEPGDLPPVIDIEEANGMSNKNIQKALKECADELEQTYGKKPIIYSNVDFYDNKLGNLFDDYPLWAAHYEQCEAPRINRKWTLWQHNCKGNVNGIEAEVDFNVVNGNLFDLKVLCLE